MLISILSLQVYSVGAMSETIVVDTTGTKKIRYLVISGGGNSALDRTSINGQAATQKDLLDKWAGLAADGSKAELSKDQSEQAITDRIQAIGKTLKDNEEFVIFFFGHGNVKTGAWQIYDFKDPFKVRDEITGDELKDALSGFAEGVTISVISGSCFSGKIETTVEDATNDMGDKYDDDLTYLGANKLLSVREWIRSLQAPFGDFDKNNLPDGDNKKDPNDKTKGDGTFTTEEFREKIEEAVEDFFTSKADPPPGDFCDVGTLDGVLVGGKLLQTDNTSLLLAGAQTFSWMIPLVLSVLGIGLFVVSRKSENS